MLPSRKTVGSITGNALQTGRFYLFSQRRRRRRDHTFVGGEVQRRFGRDALTIPSLNPLKMTSGQL
jgi:hypothetical protein